MLQSPANLESDGSDCLGQAHHDLAQLRVLCGIHQELLERVAHLSNARFGEPAYAV